MPSVELKTVEQVLKKAKLPSGKLVEIEFVKEVTPKLLTAINAIFAMLGADQIEMTGTIDQQKMRNVRAYGTWRTSEKKDRTVTFSLLKFFDLAEFKEKVAPALVSIGIYKFPW